MPIYTLECVSCGGKEDFFRKVDERNEFVSCACGGIMVRVVERFKVDVFTPYYDEGLGSDVHSRRERKRLMSELGVVEAGDAVHGGRNFDSKNPNVIGVDRELRGHVRRKHREGDAQLVEVVDANGIVVESKRFDELEPTGKPLD
jgi:hypothetical protein